MKKKNILLTIIISLLVLIPYVKASEKPSDERFYSYKGYVLDGYDVDIVVNEDNTLDIAENIEAYFYEFKHGIIRNIPIKNKIERLDGTKTTIFAKISNIQVNAPFTKSKDNNYYNLKIGSADNTVNGSHYYQIKYRYDLGNDKNKNYDELYFNIIGDEWDTGIGNITFNIEMPFSFDSSKLGFSSGGYGSVENDKITYNVEGNTITGSYNGSLNAKEALTIRLELPNDYFVKQPINLNTLLLYLGLFVSLSLLIFLVYKFSGHYKINKDTLANKNSLDITYACSESVSRRSVVSLIIYLANLGYIEIINKRGLLYLVKLKDYVGQDSRFKKILDSIFIKNEVCLNELVTKDNFSVINDINAITVQTKERNIREKIFPKSIKYLIVGLTYLTYGLFIASLLVMFYYTNLYLICGITTLILFLSIIEYFISQSDPATIKEKIRFVFMAILYLFFPLCGTIIVYIFSDNYFSMDFKLLIWTGINVLITFILWVKVVPLKVEQLNGVYSESKKLYYTLEFTSKKKIKNTLLTNPNYVYDMLPYIYSFRLMDIWQKKLKSITINPPKWYITDKDFNIYYFLNDITQLLQALEIKL